MTSHAKRVERPQKAPVKRAFYGLLAGLLVFMLGVNVGNGRIAVGANSGQVANELPANLDYSSIEAVYDTLRVTYDGDIEHKALLDGLKQGLAQATGDPYTEYFNATEAKEFDEELSGSFTGIGAELGKNQSNNIEIISPIAGFPAEKAGLKAKDVIAEIDGESTANLSISEAVKKIRGEEGTKVKLTVVRANTQELRFEITRAQITIPSVKSEIIEGNIGLLTISRFGPDTAQLAREAATGFKQAGVKGVILDLRGDPGGLLDASVSVSSLWLDKSQVVLQEKRDNVVVKNFNATGNPVLKGIKTVVLVDEGSASASEITAGALKDNKAAIIIGTKTYGKGSVQALERLADGSLLKVTSAHWFTPSGVGINKVGIAPDQKVERTEDDFKNNRDPQRQAAIDYLQR